MIKKKHKTIMEELPAIYQPMMTLTCTTIPVSMLTMMSIPGNNLTPNPTLTPMLHQATLDNPDEFTDEGTQENDHPKNKDSEKDPTNGKNTEKENRKNREDQHSKIMESTTLDDVLVDDDINIKVGKKTSDTTHLVSIEGCCPKMLPMTCLQKFCMVRSISG
jgi:hypothetical protein